MSGSLEDSSSRDASIGGDGQHALPEGVIEFKRPGEDAKLLCGGGPITLLPEADGAPGEACKTWPSSAAAAGNLLLTQAQRDTALKKDGVHTDTLSEWYTKYRTVSVASNKTYRTPADRSRMDIEAELVKELQQARENAGLSLTELAESLPVTRASVGHYEAGRRRISLNLAAMWALACGKTLFVQLLDHSGTPPELQDDKMPTVLGFPGIPFSLARLLSHLSVDRLQDLYKVAEMLKYGGSEQRAELMAAVDEIIIRRRGALIDSDSHPTPIALLVGESGAQYVATDVDAVPDDAWSTLTDADSFKGEPDSDSWRESKE